jgi:hypothetical protein
MSENKTITELSADDVEFALRELLTTRPDVRGLLPDLINDLETYEEAGVLTRDHGLIVTLVDGTVFDITITKSHR